MFNSKSYLRNSTYTTPQRVTFTVKDFTGGLNNVMSESRLKDNQSPDLLNVRFRKDGVLEKRSGLKAYDIVNSGYSLNGDLHGAWVIKIDENTETLLLHVDRDLIYVRSSDRKPVYIPWGQKSEHRSVELSVAQFQDKVYFVDNGLRIHFLKIEELENNDIPNIYYICDPPQSFKPNPKPATKGVVKEAPSVYGKPNMIDVWYEPCEYELEDGYKGVNKTENFRKRYICVHKDRLYVAGDDKDPNMLHMSDILNPYYFPASLPIQTPPDGDRITALKVFGKALIIGRQDSMYALFGNTNRDNSEEAYQLVKINTHTGVVNNKCLDVVQNFLFYVGNDSNLYKMSHVTTSNYTLVTTKLNNTVDLKKPPLNKTIWDIKNAHTYYDKYNGEWWVQLGEDSLVYNYDYMAWTRHKGCENRMMLHFNDKFTLCRDNCTFTCFDDSVYYDMDYEYPELKLPIPCYWTSKDIDFGSPVRIKQIRDTYVVSEVYDDKRTDVRVKYDIDYVSVENENRVESEISLWGKAIWDKNRFISSNISRSLPIMVGRRGKTFKIWIGNGYKFKDYVTELPHQEETEVGDLFYCNGKFYVRQPRDYETREYYRELDEEELYQPMKIYEISGLYEFKGYR